MLAALILLAHMTTAHVSQQVSTTQVASISRQEQHIRHAEHLRHLHRLHMLHIRRAESRTAVRSDLPVTVTSNHVAVLSGHLSCSGLETLWSDAGGNPRSAFIAAEIAMAESGGNQYATGPVGERGYWQIHPDHGSLSTYDAFGNARAAVIISDNGRSWYPWTTFTSGAYIGRC